MIGIVGGLLTALFWGGAGTCSARCARVIGPIATLAVGNLIGVVWLVAVALVWRGVPVDAAAGDWLRAVGYGVGSIAGLALIFRAYTTAKVGLVSATVATNGALAAILSVVVFGESVPAVVLVAIPVTMVGVAVTAWREEPPGRAGGRGATRRGAGYALAGACCFALAVLSGSHVRTLDPVWVVATGRMVGVVTVTAWVVTRHGLPRIPRTITGFAVGSPVFDGAGFLALLTAARHGVAIPAVLSTLSVLVIAALGFVVFGERLTRLQWAGVLTTLVGVATIAATR
jgi:drug/metabolite transporter (DMT)-like permease